MYIIAKKLKNYPIELYLSKTDRWVDDIERARVFSNKGHALQCINKRNRFVKMDDNVELLTICQVQLDILNKEEV